MSRVGEYYLNEALNGQKVIVVGKVKVELQGRAARPLDEVEVTSRVVDEERNVTGLEWHSLLLS